MKTSIEETLRRHFREQARGFGMEPQLPPELHRRARGRVVRAVSWALVLAVAAAAGSVAVVRADHMSQANETTVVRLLDYSGDTDGSGLRQVAACLRDQGFQVPDPTQTDQAWSILVPDSIDTSSPAWKEAVFVTCRLSRFVARPLTGELHMSFDQAGLKDFTSCMHDQGYDLPAPTLDAERNYRFDLGESGIDTNTDQWNRALLITCAPPGTG